MSAPSRRAVLAASLAVAGPAAQPSAADPDAEVLHACHEHRLRLRAVCASPGCTDSPEGASLWQAYSDASRAIGAARPRTMAGILAKARAAMSEAIVDELFDGDHDCFGFNSHAWAWELLQDLARIHGLEFEDPRTGAVFSGSVEVEA